MIKAPDQNAGMDLSADSLEEALSRAKICLDKWDSADKEGDYEGRIARIREARDWLDIAEEFMDVADAKLEKGITINETLTDLEERFTAYVYETPIMPMDEADWWFASNAIGRT